MIRTLRPFFVKNLGLQLCLRHCCLRWEHLVGALFTHRKTLRDKSIVDLPAEPLESIRDAHKFHRAMTCDCKEHAQNKCYTGISPMLGRGPQGSCTSCGKGDRDTTVCVLMCTCSVREFACAHVHAWRARVCMRMHAQAKS